MPEKSSRFQRVAYARQAARLADELLDWAKIYSTRSYRAPYFERSVESLEQLEKKSETLEELAMQLQRVSITILSLQ